MKKTWLPILGLIAGLFYFLFLGPTILEKMDYDLEPVGAPLPSDVLAVYWAKVENGVVTDMKKANYDYIMALPDSNLWIATYKDRSKRGNYAGIGYIYDATTDQFLPPKTYNSWIASTTAPVWDAPKNKPKKPLKIDEGWLWDEAQQNWTLIKITNYASSTNQQ